MPHLEAGRYAAFIWPAYAITALVFAGLIASSLAHARRWRRRCRQADGGGDRR